jgi:hypothetical protein
VLGWSLEELKSRPYLDCVHPADRDNITAEVGRLVADLLRAPFISG